MKDLSDVGEVVGVAWPSSSGCVHVGRAELCLVVAFVRLPVDGTATHLLAPGGDA